MTEMTLQAKIADLEQQIIVLTQEAQRHEQDRKLLDVLFHDSQLPISIIDILPEGRFYFHHQNPRAAAMVGINLVEWDGVLPSNPMDESGTLVLQRLTTCRDAGVTMQFEDKLELPIGTRWLQTVYSPVHDKTGRVAQITAVTFDITERRQRDIEALERQQALIEQQSATLEELSTPMLAINERTVVMPLVGTIDERRAEQIMEALLLGIAGSGATIAILDITGVAVVDTQVANALVRAARAVKLLGSEVVITGIRPEVAQTLVGLGIELNDIITRGTLQMGIAYAL